MIEITKKENIGGLQQKLKLSINEYEKNLTALAFDIDLKDEFIGNVNNKNFWIQRTRPRLFRGPTRAFYGKFVEIGKDTKIVGKFKFLKIYRILINILHVMISILLSYQFFYKVLNVKEFILLLLILNVFFEGLLLLNILLYKKEENSVINLLKKL